LTPFSLFSHFGPTLVFFCPARTSPFTPNVDPCLGSFFPMVTAILVVTFFSQQCASWLLPLSFPLVPLVGPFPDPLLPSAGLRLSRACTSSLPYVPASLEFPSIHGRHFFSSSKVCLTRIYETPPPQAAVRSPESADGSIPQAS